MMQRSKRAAQAARVAGAVALVIVACVATGCAHSGRGSSASASETTTTTTTTTTPTPTGGAVTPPPSATTEPERIQVQHVLIGFKGSVPGKPITRTQDEAKTLAYSVLERARGGESFDELVKQHTDDSAPGIYGMSNNGVAPDPSKGEYARGGMVGAFGDVGFKLAVGEVGIADYDPRTSPFGYHVIKRLR